MINYNHIKIRKYGKMEDNESQVYSEALALLNKNNPEEAFTLVSTLPFCEKKLLTLAEICEKKGDVSGAKQNLLRAQKSFGTSLSKLALSNFMKRRREAFIASLPKKSGEITFCGKPVRFNVKNVPVCAKTQFKDGKNTLIIDVNLVMRSMRDLKLKKPDRAVIQGIKGWQGEYRVFGGYPVNVKINCTSRLKKKNSLIINILDKKTADSVVSILSKLGGKNAKRSARIIEQKRQSAAAFGLSWRPSGVKYINIFEEDLIDVRRCKFLIRHEFGHILGLDDMYSEKEDGRPGVLKNYPDIEFYRLSGKEFYMVMCSYDAPVCDKEIEMTLLAYLEKKLQRFYPRFNKGEISKALTDN